MDGQKCYLSTSRVKHAYYCNKGANKWSFMISWCIRVVFVGTNFLNRGLDQGFEIQFGKKFGPNSQPNWGNLGGSVCE